MGRVLSCRFKCIALKSQQEQSSVSLMYTRAVLTNWFIWCTLRPTSCMQDFLVKTVTFGLNIFHCISTKVTLTARQHGQITVMCIGKIKLQNLDIKEQCNIYKIPEHSLCVRIILLCCSVAFVPLCFPYIQVCLHAAVCCQIHCISPADWVGCITQTWQPEGEGKSTALLP